jgi:hypothetical protein
MDGRSLESLHVVLNNEAPVKGGTLGATATYNVPHSRFRDVDDYTSLILPVSRYILEFDILDQRSLK